MSSRFLKGSGGRLEIGFYLHREFCRGRDRILDTQRIPGVDLVENRCLLSGKLANVCGFSDFARGDIARESGDIQRWKQRLQGPKFSMGAMLMKIVILLKENWSHIDNFL